MRVGPVKSGNLSNRTAGFVLLVLAASLSNAAAPSAATGSLVQGTGPVSTVETQVSATIKESAVVSRVKARLAARHLSTLVTVKVTTDDDGIVWLSGTVPTFDASAQAARIAMETEGVVAVHNGIVVH